MIVGMDFGTTNSGMAVYNGRSVRVLPLDPMNQNPQVARTALYITTEQSVSIGREAINLYFAQNIGRAVKLKKVWIGELEVFGGDMYYVTDVYAYIDVLSPGRLFLSIKTGLRDKSYVGTVVGQDFYYLEDLIALYLYVTKVRAEKLLGRELKQVVLGRPVHFGHSDEQDRLAQARLLRAAFKAGYEEVFLQYEPVAAAFRYSMELERAQNVLVFDFGGGTLDITVMRLGGGEYRVLATGGVPVAGDVFDQKIVRTKLPRHFGEGSTYGSRHRQLTIPRWIYDAFSDWQSVLTLQTAENRQILQEIARTAQKRYQIEALISLVQNNYALQMFDVVEQAKRRLSEKRGAEILLDGPGFHVREFITRTEFERIIRNEIVAIDAHVDEVVGLSGLRADEIDAVIRTGGSAQIPVFHEMLCRKFGAARVKSVDTFSSVTAGLSVVGYLLEEGKLDMPVYRPEDLRLPKSELSVPPKARVVELEMLKRRIWLVESGGVVETDQRAMVALTANGLATAVSFASDQALSDTLLWSELQLAESALPCLVADMDEKLLLVTTHYRFLLVTPRQLMDLDSAELSLRQVHFMGEKERVCAVARWSDLVARERVLLVTSTGLARPYPTDILKANIEMPVPYKFDTPLPGIVVNLYGVDKVGMLLAVTKSGRAVRYSVSAIRHGGTQILNCGETDRVVGSVVAAEEDELLLVTEDGYGRSLKPAWIPHPPKPNSKGRSVIARRSPVVGIVPVSDQLRTWLVTEKGCVRVNNGRFKPTKSTKSSPLLPTAPEVTVRQVFSLPYQKATNRAK